MNRRYDIDWLRVIAIGLLLIYHVAIGFQPWGIMIAFITNDEPWQGLWAPMSMLNIWRIPFLFFVSGMGVYFAMQQRDLKGLLKERAMRIFLPFIFGAVCIFPICLLMWQYHNHMPLSYTVSPGHLWFLGNIMCYVVVLSPLLYYLKNHQEGKFVSTLQRLFSSPPGLLLVTGLFVIEAQVLKPFPYEMYAMTWHGFALGFLAFFCGFCLVLAGKPFWDMLLRWKWMFLALAVTGSVVRIIIGIKMPVYVLVFESHAWIFSCFAFGHHYLNRPGKSLRYLSEAAYPVYILHMLFLYAGSMAIFPLQIAVQLKFVLLLIITIAGCFGAYEIIRRVRWLRPLFGLKHISQDAHADRRSFLWQRVEKKVL